MKAKNSRTTPIFSSLVNVATSLAVLILAFLGIGISGYLTYIHYQSLNSICLFGAKCDTVLTSHYAQMWGIPLSLFGLIMYVVLMGLGLLLLWGKGEWQDRLALGTYTLALSGTLFTGYLYYLEIFVIHAFCSWCIASSIIIVSILLISILNLLGRQSAKEKKSHSKQFTFSHSIH